MEEFLDDHVIALAQACLTSFYQILEGAGSVPPDMRFRTEGKLEMLLALQLLDREQLLTMIEATFNLIIDAEAFEDATARRRCVDEQGQNVHLPALMERAPVYPSTSE